MGKGVVIGLGIFIMAADVIVFLTERVGITLTQHTVTPWSATEITGHAVILFIGYLLVDHDRALSAFTAVKDRLPLIGKKDV